MHGFHPDLVIVEMVFVCFIHILFFLKLFILNFKGKSVLFDWRDTNQPHNIIHVALPNDKVNIYLTIHINDKLIIIIN